MKELIEVFDSFDIRIDSEKRNEIYAKAMDRISLEIPPGTDDKPKGLPEFKDGKFAPLAKQLGDAVIWLQLLAECRQRDLPAIFITKEKKKDWYTSFGPTEGHINKQLAAEFFDEVGHPIILISIEDFVSQAPKRIKEIKISDSTARTTKSVEAGLSKSRWDTIRESFENNPINDGVINPYSVHTRLSTELDTASTEIQHLKNQMTMLSRDLDYIEARIAHSTDKDASPFIPHREILLKRKIELENRIQNLENRRQSAFLQAVKRFKAMSSPTESDT